MSTKRGHISQAKSPSGLHRSNSPKIVIQHAKQQSTSQKDRGRPTPTGSRKSPVSTHESDRRKGTPSLDQDHLEILHDSALSSIHNEKHDALQELQIETQFVPVPLPPVVQHQQQQQPDDFFLQKELISEPVDSEVETYLNDGARRALEAMVNEQRKIATSVDTGVETQGGSSRTSPSLSTSQELAKDYIDGTKSHKGILKPVQSAPKSNKFTGGFYIVKGRGATGVMAPVPMKGERQSDGFFTNDTENNIYSDDNDSSSTVGVVVSQFASIDGTSGVPARKNSDDEISSTSDHTVTEPYLTSIRSEVPYDGAQVKPVSHDDRRLAPDHVPMSTPLTNASETNDISKDNVTDGDALATTETCDNKLNMEFNNDKIHGEYSGESSPSQAMHKEFVTLHDNLDLLSDEALLSLSELRSKIDEVDRIRVKREITLKKSKMSRPTTIIRPTAPVSRRGSGTRIVKGTRGAWEEPPAGRMHGIRVSDKMFQSTLHDSSEGIPTGAITETTIVPASSVFGTSPGSRVGPSNFSGSRPNSRGAIDSKNANMKNAITAIIRTNATYGGGETGDVPSAAVRGLRTSASRNSARKAHLSYGVSPLDLALAEARAMGSSLIISPRTAFDDRSVSSTDSYRSYSSQYSSEAGISLGSPRTTLRKSALSIAMAEVDSVPSSIQSKNVQEIESDYLTTTPLTTVESTATVGNDDPNNLEIRSTNAEPRSQKTEDVYHHCGRSTPIPIITPRISTTEPHDKARQQSGSAPAQISVEREKPTILRQSTEDDEEELKGIF